MFDDILGGGEEPPRPKRGRPSNEDLRRRGEEQMRRATERVRLSRAARGETLVKPEDFREMIVGRNWLGKAFGMDADKTVKKRLANVEPHVRMGANRELYLLVEIIPHLLKPKMDIGTYLKTLNPTDMPASVNKTFWEAERIKNKVLIETGEAWHDSQVLDVLGRVFMMIKDRIPIIVEGMREAGLSDEQCALLTGYTDQFQQDLYEALVEQPKLHRTAPRKAELEIYDGADEERFEEEDE